MNASFFVQFSNAAITTMIGISIAASGGSQSDVALVAGCYSLGFIIGCFVSPSRIQRVGLIRAFAAGAALLTITIVGLEIFDGVGAMALIRFMMGMSVALVLAVSDSWINLISPSDKRGRVIAVYAIVLGAASIASQMVFLFLDSVTNGFVLVFAITMNISVVLVAMTSASAPQVVRVSGRSRTFFIRVPLVPAVNAFAAGFVTTSFVSIVPFHLANSGVEENTVAMMLAALYLGRLLFQWPVGMISDRLDRRLVLAGLALGAGLLAILWLATDSGGGRYLGDTTGSLHTAVGLIYVLLLGGMIYPIQSVATAVAFDRAEEGNLPQTATTMLGLNSVGSILGPFMVMVVGGGLGDSALMVCILILCSAACLVSLVKKASAEAPEQKGSVMAASQNSVEMAEIAAELAEEQIEAHQAEEPEGSELL
jgi:MFS family permease